MTELIFSCSAEKPRFIVQALSAIAWKEKEDQFCTAIVSNKGIAFSTEDTAIVQATVLLRDTFFKSFLFCRDSQFEFRLNLTNFVRCISLYADTATRLEIRAHNESDILIEVFEPFSTTQCVLRTLFLQPNTGTRPDLSKAFQTSESPEVVSFMLSSEMIKEMFIFPSQANLNSTNFCLKFDPREKMFEVKAEGSYGSVCSSMPFSVLRQNNFKNDLTEPLSSSYSAVSIGPVIKAFSISSQTMFKFRSNGMLYVQQAISSESTGSVAIAVEFVLQPIDENIAA